MTKRQMKELESSSEDYKALAWLKESNNKMRQDLLHVCDTVIGARSETLTVTNANN